MKRFLKAILPTSFINHLREVKNRTAWRRLHAGWDGAAGEITLNPVCAQPGRGLLIFPSDSAGITGAVGDDAMISSVLGAFQGIPDQKVSILCTPGGAEDIVRAKGAIPVVLPDFLGFPATMAALLNRGGYDTLVCLGADVMDGYYSPEYSTQILVAADLAARAGMRSILLGFSFNDKAAPELARCFERLDPRVEVNLRDVISFERLKHFASVPQARLVADSAFTLQPGEVDADTFAWITAEKAAGRKVIGINMHPMLIKGVTPAQVEGMVAEMATAILAVDGSESAGWSWLLVPHDYRDDRGDGDGIALRPLAARLSADSAIRLRYFEGEHRATTLKALAGQLDGVVTGRMHFAIAAIGMGVPVMCLTYQDKFEGLFRHFDLPLSLLLPPAVFGEPGALAERLAGFLAELDGLRSTVERERPRVLALAQKNFIILENN